MRLLLAISAALIFLRVWDPWPIETLRLKYFDALLTLDEIHPSTTVALYNVDEKALEEKGQWPWPREFLAELNEELAAQGAAAIVYTVLFPEPDRFGGDEAFAASMQAVPTVLSATTTVQTERQEGWHVGVSMLGPVKDHVIQYPGILPNTPLLQTQALGTGVVSTAPEVDGLVRRIPMLVRVGEALYPALGLDVLRVLVGDPSYQVKASGEGLTAVRVPGFAVINTDSQGQVWIKWNTRFESNVQNKIVFVGVTAEGITPLVPTPRGLMYPHEIQANLFETLLNGTAPVRPDWALGAEFLGLLSFLALIIVAGRLLPVLWIPVSLLFLGGIAASASVWGYIRFGYLIDAAIPVVFGAVVGSVQAFSRMIQEYRLRLQIKKQFEHYLDPRQVKRLQDNPELLQLGGETREATFLFTDIRGFTPLSEKFQDNPEGLVRLINRFLTALTDELTQSGAMIDKFIGDCIMAVWNAPMDVADHRRVAIATAEKMLVRLKALNTELEAEGLPTIAIGIGINTGRAVIGNMGSDSRFDYSCIGDSVNTAARFESSTKEVGVDVIIGESTAQGMEDTLKALPPIRVKGKTEALTIYTIEYT